MLKAAFAGALALALSGTGLQAAEDTPPSVQAQPAARLVITEANIARLKHVLRLTATQEAYWPPVEAALRDLAHHQSQADLENAGVMRRLARRAKYIAVDAVQLRRAVAAAMPLIQSLSEEQKRDALGLARSMGLGGLSLAF